MIKRGKRLSLVKGESLCFFYTGLSRFLRWLKPIFRLAVTDIFRMAETDIFRLAKPAKKGGKSGKQNVRNKYALVTM